MMTLLIRKEILPEDWARFYLAQVRTRTRGAVPAAAQTGRRCRAAWRSAAAVLGPACLLPAPWCIRPSLLWDPSAPACSVSQLHHPTRLPCTAWRRP